ncbi:MAG: GNAT family N-acetyltransferase [Actinomycetota bacterium]|nr:GNAT family N-acetyltransferase [Actinomycetota bacterium]
MTLELRACGPDDFPDVVKPILHYFGRSEPGTAFAERFGRLLPPDRIHAVFDDGAPVGSGGAFPFEIGIPGGTTRAAGITLVGVLPPYRRRGILRQLMRAQIDDIHQHGEAIAYLWASEDALYGRFGYGVASFCGDIDVPRERAQFHGDVDPRGTVRLLEKQEALEPLSRIQRAAAARHPGMFVRPREWWEDRTFADPEWAREGGGEQVRALLEFDGRPAAYALYRLHFRADRGVATGFTSVIEAVGDSPQAIREIWRYLLSIDWMARVRAELLPLDHELFLLLREPRRLRFNLRDGLWVRLVDVEAALGARTFKHGEPVVLDVVDEFCPWNAGRYVVGPDGAQRTDGEAQLRLPVQSLGSAYLGGFTFSQLARAGRAEELVEGALDRADALFRADRYPWCPEIF